ncbi:alcohol dehydrogenase catalytic domain-containing protein [Marispirochaeta aestuarii]|uniref:zinc-dependent alcohol dehydrogenase n=1 Tax=Marispirochaeta aestuarii TaxID=1963862 RepID=UPI0029C8137A|nr:alcohol dehydrogenase catalytic domain-containing protein [Marispirochaeta aestuarii]
MLQTRLPEAYTVEYRDVPVPEIGPEEVLIKVKRFGICGSDIQVYHGQHKYMTFPVVQGHEASGTLEKIGDKVSGLKVGQAVTVQPQIFCGVCQPCKSGHPNVCQNLRVYGVHTDGLGQEYFAVPAEKIIPLPEGCSFDDGALIEPITVGVGAIRRCGDVKDRNICILGAGPIGNFTAQVAQAKGAQVMVTDINQKKLDLAASMGIKNTINTENRDLKTCIADVFGPAGADIIIDCAGAPASLTSAIKSARPASKIVIVANFKVPVEVEIPLIQRQQIDVLGVMMYIKEDFFTAVDLVSQGKVTTEGIISEYFDISKLKEAYEYIDANRLDVNKVMMTFGE